MGTTSIAKTRRKIVTRRVMLSASWINKINDHPEARFIERILVSSHVVPVPLWAYIRDS